MIGDLSQLTGGLIYLFAVDGADLNTDGYRELLRYRADDLVRIGP